MRVLYVGPDAYIYAGVCMSAYKYIFFLLLPISKAFLPSLYSLQILLDEQ